MKPCLRIEEERQNGDSMSQVFGKQLFKSFMALDAQKLYPQLGVIMHTFNPSTKDTEAGESL